MSSLPFYLCTVGGNMTAVRVFPSWCNIHNTFYHLMTCKIVQAKEHSLAQHSTPIILLKNVEYHELPDQNKQRHSRETKQTPNWLDDKFLTTQEFSSSIQSGVRKVDTFIVLSCYMEGICYTLQPHPIIVQLWSKVQPFYKTNLINYTRLTCAHNLTILFSYTKNVGPIFWYFETNRSDNIARPIFWEFSLRYGICTRFIQ